MTTRNHLNDYFSDTIRKNWDRMALTDFDGASYQYKDVARKIAKLHLLFNHVGIKPGDKIALCGRNSSAWAVTFFAALTYGAVIVPILHEFKADTIHHLVNHSDARLFFVDRNLWDDLDPESMQALSGVLAINDYASLFSRDEKLDYARAHLNEMFGHAYPERFTADNVRYYADKPDEIALISYTSGSTGFSKGVMLTFGNLRSNLIYCLENLGMLKPGDGIVSMLPMAHMYGLMVDVIYGFSVGANLNFLTRVPSPRVITAAFEKVKPKLIVAVPLIIEKIIRTRVYPLLEKPLMKLLLRVPYVDDRLLGKVKKKLQASFGDNVCEIILGGAAVNPEVEKFLKKIGFPYTIGYGMTECGPLISYSPWREARTGSCGRTVDRMSIRIDSPDPQRTPGVLWVKGENVMAGYYKNPDATAAVMRDGWMSTGDICTVDGDGFIYILGRDKNMILGPSGQNIYPEEIEHSLNNMALVGESLIVEDKGKLVALIYPDYDAAQAMGLNEAAIDSTMRENISQLNREIPSYSQVSTFRIMDEEFEKTPKRSIKRYLYQHS